MIPSEMIDTTIENLNEIAEPSELRPTNTA